MECQLTTSSFRKRPLVKLSTSATRFNTSANATKWNRGEGKKNNSVMALAHRKGLGLVHGKGLGQKNLFPVVVCLTMSDWADGFGPSKVKCNRTTMDVKTITISPTKQEVKATNNTFACAVGIKGNHKGWEAVAQRFYQVMSSLTSSKEPFLFYHGDLTKMVLCFIMRPAVIGDRPPERNDLTGTKSHSGDLHWRFSVSGIIQHPVCNQPCWQAMEWESFPMNSRSSEQTKIHSQTGSALPLTAGLIQTSLSALQPHFETQSLNDL